MKGVRSCVNGPDCLTIVHRISLSDNFDIRVCSPCMDVVIFLRKIIFTRFRIWYLFTAITIQKIFDYSFNKCLTATSREPFEPKA
ncbi:MAG: hypothetical protein WCF06_11270, partial [Nitrososphaeraceae archaeon]